MEPQAKSAIATQTGCRQCNRVNMPGAIYCAGCGIPLSDPAATGDRQSTTANRPSSMLDASPSGEREAAGVTSTAHHAPHTAFRTGLLAEKQDPRLARLCFDQTVGLLAEKEEIEYIVTVDPEEASNEYICAVATNRRVFVYSKRGTQDVDLENPQAYFWQDMAEIHFEEEPEISLRLIGISGWHVELKDVHPPQARRLYVYGVDHSERVLRNRVEQHFITHAGAPYVSGPLDESALEQNNAATPPAAATSATSVSSAITLPIVPRNPLSDAEIAQPAPEAPRPFSSPSSPMVSELPAVETRPATGNTNPPPSRPSAGAGSVLSNVMRAVQAADNASGGLGAPPNASNPHLSGPTSSPLTGQWPQSGDAASMMQNVMRMAQTQDTGFASDGLSGRLPDGHPSEPLAGAAGQPPAYDGLTGRLPYAFDPATGPMPWQAYDPNTVPSPLAGQPQPMPQVMPYLHPSQQPYVQTPYPQPDPQQYGQPQYGYPPNQYQYPLPQPQYGQQPYGNQYAPYVQQPPPYAPPQFQPQPQPQPQAYPQPEPASMNYAAEAQPQAPVEDGEDIVTRLQKLKTLLDADLITDEDYQAKKVQLLEEM